MKNQGYHLEHNFGHGSQHLSETLFLLNLLAYFVHQILELVDQVYQNARAGLSSRVEFWNVMRGSFRLLMYASWDEVLSRITGPRSGIFPILTSKLTPPERADLLCYAQLPLPKPYLRANSAPRAEHRFPG